MESLFPLHAYALCEVVSILGADVEFAKMCDILVIFVKSEKKWKSENVNKCLHAYNKIAHLN